jgi:hypothetical protein
LPLEPEGIPQTGSWSPMIGPSFPAPPRITSLPPFPVMTPSQMKNAAVADQEAIVSTAARNSVVATILRDEKDAEAVSGESGALSRPTVDRVVASGTTNDQPFVVAGDRICARASDEHIGAATLDNALEKDRVSVADQRVVTVTALQAVVPPPEAVPSFVLLSPAIRSRPEPPKIWSLPPPLALP